MADFDVSALKEMQEWAKFGKSVVELAKSYNLIPKRQVVKTKTVERIKVVMRRPRRTKAEMLAARAVESAAREAEAPSTDSLAEVPVTSSGALDALMK